MIQRLYAYWRRYRLRKRVEEAAVRLHNILLLSDFVRRELIALEQEITELKEQV